MRWGHHPHMMHCHHGGHCGGHRGMHR
jgi:hypothetical protein